MYHLKYFLINLIVFAGLLSATAQAQLSPHGTTNFDDCSLCHASTGHGGVTTIVIPRGAEQERVCKTCHNPEGIASSMSNVANHVVNGDTIIECSACHDPHAQNSVTDPHTNIYAPNLSLIRSNAIQFNNTDLIFQQNPENFAFAEANTPWNGICQACHTATAHHTNDASADHDHEIGTDCTGCHSHQDGFKASGGSCTGCHSSPQNTRRAVVGEFPVDNAHAHYGATLDSDACLACHSVATHMDGYVELVDPDDESVIYRFMQPEDLTSDPDFSDFCSGCHDNDGAQRLASPNDPFGNGNTPPDVATRFKGTLQWNELQGDMCFGTEGTLRQVNSHHDISDSDQAWSGAKVECLNCHGAHNASADTPVADPSNQTQPWAGTMNEFCLSCHYGGNGPIEPGFPASAIGTDVYGPTIAMRGLEADNCAAYNVAPWWVDYTWSYTPHGADSKRGWPGYSGAPSYELNCTDCHDPHGSYTPTNTLGNPYMIRDFVDGTAYIDDGNRPQGNYVPGTTGTAGSVVVTISGTTVDWGSAGSLCTKCHETWLSAYSWHSYCNACMNCHGHGQSWDGSDWGTQTGNDTRCVELGYGAASTTGGAGGLVPDSGPGHEALGEQDCSACHVTIHR